MLKFCRATAPESTSVIVRSREIGSCPSTPCTSRSIAARRDNGSVCSANGPRQRNDAVRERRQPSVIWLCGTYITPTPALLNRFRARFRRCRQSVWPAPRIAARVLCRSRSLSDRISIRPVFLRHRVIDDHHASGAARIRFGEHASAQQRNLEHAEVMRRYRSPLLIAVVLALLGRFANDRERQIDARLDRQHDGRGRRFDSWQRLHASNDLRGEAVTFAVVE